MEPPIDHYKEGLKIKNYFDLLEYCRQNNLDICNNDRFWKDKLRQDFHILTDNNNYQGKYKSLYQSWLSNILFYITTDSTNYEDKVKIYGTDKDDLLDKSSELRKEANKSFSLPHDRKL